MDTRSRKASQRSKKGKEKATSLDPWNVADYKRVMNQKKQALRRGRTYVGRSFMAEITKGKGIWKMVKWAKTKADKPQTTPQCPPLQRSAQESPTFDNNIRTRILADKFFPPPEEADLADIPATVYLESITIRQQITEEMITSALKKMSPDKVPGPDEAQMESRTRSSRNASKNSCQSSSQHSINV